MVGHYCYCYYCCPVDTYTSRYEQLTAAELMSTRELTRPILLAARSSSKRGLPSPATYQPTYSSSTSYCTTTLHEPISDLLSLPSCDALRCLRPQGQGTSQNPTPTAFPRWVYIDSDRMYLHFWTQAYLKPPGTIICYCRGRHVLSGLSTLYGERERGRPGKFSSSLPGT